MRDLVLVDRDQAEAARRERIAEHRVDTRADARRTTAHFAQDEIARLGILEVTDEQFAPLALVDRRKPGALAVAPDHPEHQLGRPLELLHRVGDEPLPLLLGAAQHPIADAERAALAALHEAQARRRRFCMPLLRNRPDAPAVVHRLHSQHSHLWHTARLVERAAGRAIDQPLVGHVLEQALQIDLLLPRQSERPRNLALARRLIG